MNYKYKVGASFPRKLLRKGEAQSQVQSEEKAGLQPARYSFPFSKTKAQTNTLFFLKAPPCLVTLHPVLAKDLWDQERETNTSLCRSENSAQTQWFWEKKTFVINKPNQCDG